MPGQLEFPKLITVMPYTRPGFPVDSPTLCVDTVRSFSLITDDGDIVATLSMWHTSESAYARMYDKYDKQSYEAGISKDQLKYDKSMLERAVTDMLVWSGMKLSAAGQV